MMEKSLLPCPFCGDTNLSPSYQGQPSMEWRMACNTCGATGPLHYDASVAGGMGPNGDLSETWNKRASPPDQGSVAQSTIVNQTTCIGLHKMATATAAQGTPLTATTIESLGMTSIANKLFNKYHKQKPSNAEINELYAAIRTLERQLGEAQRELAGQGREIEAHLYTHSELKRLLVAQRERADTLEQRLAQVSQELEATKGALKLSAETNAKLSTMRKPDGALVKLFDYLVENCLSVTTDAIESPNYAQGLLMFAFMDKYDDRKRSFLAALRQAALAGGGGHEAD